MFPTTATASISTLPPYFTSIHYFKFKFIALIRFTLGKAATWYAALAGKLSEKSMKLISLLKHTLLT